MSSPNANAPNHVLHKPYQPKQPAREAIAQFHEVLGQRRSIRDFSDRPVEQELIEWVVKSAATAPSGANKQPWRFVCVKDPMIKRRIREAAEIEEREFYQLFVEYDGSVN